MASNTETYQGKSATSHHEHSKREGYHDNYQASRVRLAELRDSPALVTLFSQAYPDTAENEETMQYWLEQGGALLLEDSSGQAISAVRWLETAHGWQLDRVATLPSQHGKGFGRWLLTRVEALAIQRNVASLQLPLHIEDEAWLGYYERMGYHRSDHPLQGDEGDEAMVLRKQVGGVWQLKDTHL